jgi:hypothetical protein
MHAKQDIIQEADRNHTITAQNNLACYSKNTLSVKADGTLAIQSAQGSWNAGSQMTVTAGGIDLNGPSAPAVQPPTPIAKIQLDTVTFSTNKGWVEDRGNLETICNRAPTHEPWPYHNLGVDVKIDYETGTPTPPPAAPPIPAGVTVRVR